MRPLEGLCYILFIAAISLTLHADYSFDKPNKKLKAAAFVLALLAVISGLM